jgi:hypothetical protein
MPAISLEKGTPNSVFDSDGSALVLHAKPATIEQILPATPAFALFAVSLKND